MMLTLMQQRLFQGLLILIVSLMLTGCETDKIERTKLGIQQNLFLQSLELVESAGNILQKPGLEPVDIETAMGQMDKGMQQAFQVEAGFLEKLDPRLPRLYSKTFIIGVENYRIGVEAANREKQLEGLGLLKQWSRFWLDEKPGILQKMVELTGLPANQS